MSKNQKNQKKAKADKRKNNKCDAKQQIVVPDLKGTSTKKTLQRMDFGRRDPSEDMSYMVETIDLTPNSVDLEKRICTFVAATDRMIDRYWWKERLIITRESIDTSRLDIGISFLDSHRHSQVHGKSVGYSINEEKGLLEIKVRFSKKKESDDIFQDIVDGIRIYVSIGYAILEQTVTSFEGEDRDPEYVVKRWQPLELSSVGVPADENSTSRSHHQNRKTDEDNMSKPNEEKGGGDNSVKIEQRAKDLAQQAIDKNDAIINLGIKYDMVNEARKAIQENVSVREFQSQVLDKMSEDSKSKKPATNLDMEDGQIREYSVFDAVSAFSKGGIEGMRKHAPLEYEAHVAVQKSVGRDAQGFYLPMDIQNDFGRRLASLKRGPQSREMLVSSATQGGALVGTDHRGDLFIDHLMDRSVVMSLGARRIENLVGDVDIPRGEGGVTFEWVGEASAPTPSHGLIGTVSLVYKTLAASVEISRKLLKQSSPSAEAYIIDLILRGNALALDNAAIFGAGGNSILGILNTTGINVVPVAGSFANWGEVIDFEDAVAGDNALIDMMSWIVANNVAGGWKRTLKSAGVAGYIAENNTCNSYDFHRKTSLAAGTTLFGNMTDFVFGFWGIMDLMVDKSTNASEGGTVLRSFHDVDGAVTNTGSFAKNGT